MLKFYDSAQMSEKVRMPWQFNFEHWNKATCNIFFYYSGTKSLSCDFIIFRAFQQHRDDAVIVYFKLKREILSWLKRNITNLLDSVLTKISNRFEWLTSKSKSPSNTNQCSARRKCMFLLPALIYILAVSTDLKTQVHWFCVHLNSEL